MRKVRTGSVVRVSMDQTAVVEMVWKQRNRLYRKQVRRVARFKVHDVLNQCQLGDVVRIEETRPISKTKHWRLLEVLSRRQVADVRPIELEADAEPPQADAEPIDSAEDLLEQEELEGEALPEEALPEEAVPEVVDEDPDPDQQDTEA